MAVLDNLARNLACVEQKTESARLRLFETSDISIEESYLMKRILRGFGNLNSLVLWWAADDQMLNIIGKIEMKNKRDRPLEFIVVLQVRLVITWNRLMFGDHPESQT